MSSLSALYLRKKQLEELKSNVQNVESLINNGNNNLNIADGNIVKCFLINKGKADNKKINNIIKKCTSIFAMISNIYAKIDSEIKKIELAIEAEIRRLEAEEESNKKPKKIKKKYYTNI